MAAIKEQRVDPTLLLPEEPMTYEIKKKKKKKRKHQEDPFKDIQDVSVKPPVIIEKMPESSIDPEISIKVENIEVELDFNEFVNDNGLMLECPQSEDSQEPAISIDAQKKTNHEAAILTLENIISKKRTKTEQNQIYTCSICHLVFKSPRTLKLHQRNKHKLHKKSFKYICDDCGMSYEQKTSLLTHYKRKHGANSQPEDKDEKVCDICTLVFKGAMRLRMHMQRKHNSFTESFQHQCSDCGLTYDKHSSLIAHRKRKHLNTVKRVELFNCPLCPKTYTSRDTYVRHIQRSHNAEKNIKVPTELLPNLEEVNETGEVPCKQCPLVFSSLMYLKLHMRRKHNAYIDEYKLKCNICNMSYDKIESLKRHIRRKHSSLVYCDICHKEFKSNEEYINHKHDTKILECQTCGLIFASQGGLKKHMRFTHKIDFGPKTAVCHLCNEGFYETKQLKHHLVRKHMNVMYPCKFCSKTFKTKESFRRHSLKFHPENFSLDSNRHQCDLCPEVFPNEIELCKHIQISHSKSPPIKTEVENVVIKKETNEDDQKPTLQCTKCSDSCDSFESLRKHYELYHQVVHKVQCQCCGEFIAEQDLEKHTKSAHPILVDLKCSHCDFETTSKVSLTQHTLRHKDISTITCEFPGCKYKTYFQESMDKHKQKHAELGVKFQCSKCPFQTMNKYILRYHEEVHLTGKKKYKCKDCDYSTILPANLVQHRYKHSIVKRFKCEYCPFATKYNTSLRFHVKKKHCDLVS